MLPIRRKEPKELPKGSLLINNTDLNPIEETQVFDLINNAFLKQQNLKDSVELTQDSAKIGHPPEETTSKFDKIYQQIDKSLYPNKYKSGLHSAMGTSYREKSIFEKLYVLDLINYVANNHHLFEDAHSLAFVQSFDDESKTFTQGRVIRGKLGTGPLCRACQEVVESCQRGYKVETLSLLGTLSDTLVQGGVIDSSKYLQAINGPIHGSDEKSNYYELRYTNTRDPLKRNLEFNKDVLDNAWTRQYHHQKGLESASAIAANDTARIETGSAEAIKTESRSTSPLSVFRLSATTLAEQKEGRS